MSNNVNPRSEKVYRILVKLKKKKKLGPKVSLIYPHGVVPKGHQKFSHSLK